MPENSMDGNAFKAAFPFAIPIFAVFVFLGVAYGIYMNTSGFGAWHPILMSLLIFAGSMEFVAVGLLLGGNTLYTLPVQLVF